MLNCRLDQDSCTCRLFVAGMWIQLDQAVVVNIMYPIVIRIEIEPCFKGFKFKFTKKFFLFNCLLFSLTQHLLRLLLLALLLYPIIHP